MAVLKTRHARRDALATKGLLVSFGAAVLETHQARCIFPDSSLAFGGSGSGKRAMHVGSDSSVRLRVWVTRRDGLHVDSWNAPAPSCYACYRKRGELGFEETNVFAGEILIDANRLFPVAGKRVPTIAVRHTPTIRIPPPPPAISSFDPHSDWLRLSFVYL